ncbi:hypothetical protein [Dyadobacter sp. CY347]|uniref:hypothetical protein n=1 Tax=Dyadobacter sp. CY347 TaxID=2909336 RepID=UPI001F380F4C|nr:hypothetical protein [Dyadobacter sp. CY347]MCF2487072.1 hypothetical protein [Dyadobacter sp. CY347]
MNKVALLPIIFLFLFLPISCLNKVDPAVDSLYLKGEDWKSWRKDALSKLYAHYNNSKKDKECYEVIARKEDRFFLNFYPQGQLLTLCADPGSGWSNQYKADISLIKKLISYNVTFDDLVGLTENNYDSILVINKPFIEVKTNGNP